MFRFFILEWKYRMHINSDYTIKYRIDGIKHTDKKEKKSDIKDSGMKNFPLSYGMTNVVFCGNKKTNTEMEKPLPFFEPYNMLIINTIKNLVSDGKSVNFYNKYIDSLDIFKNNIKSFIKGGGAEFFGFNADTSFLEINLLDYVNDPTNAISIIKQQLEKEEKDNNKTVLFLKGVGTFLNKIDDPKAFYESSIFEENPTIFFIEEGYDRIRRDDFSLIKEGLKESENVADRIDMRSEFKQQFSKYAFLRNIVFDKLDFPSVSSDYILEYLSNKDVQKKLLSNDKNISIDENVFEFVLEYAKAVAFSQTDCINPKHEERILDDKTEALPGIIELLRKVIALKLIVNPEAKSVSFRDMLTAIPGGFKIIDRIKKFQNAQKEFIELNYGLPEENIDSPKKSEEDTKNCEKIKDKIENNQTKGVFDIVSCPTTKFSDIGGMYNIKRQIKEEFIDIIKNPNIKNEQKPSGILLSGPPGCGKTLLARAIAGEAEIPFISTAGSSFIEIFVGSGPKRVRELYSIAKEEAKKHPSKTAIVFIDEVDAIATSRQEKSNSEDLKTINALLHEMDGSTNKESNDIKIITIVATNYEGMIDSAFKRSGRIDLKYNIDDPRYSIKAREEILKIHSREINFENDEEKAKLIHELAISTSGLSGADLSELLKKAHRMSLNVNRKNNFVTAKDINEAKMQIIAGIKTDIECTNYEYKQTIAHEAGHAISSMILEKVFENEPNKHKMPSKVLDFITNSARGNTLGATYFKPSEESKMNSKEANLVDIICLYGGYTVESELFETHSTGVSQDLESATNIIENAISKYDFGAEKHYMSLNSNLTKSLFADEIKKEMLSFSKKGMEISKLIISFTKPFIEEYIKGLIDNLDSSQIVTADEFKETFNTWLKRTGKVSEYEELCKNIKTQIYEFCSEKPVNKRKIGFLN